jgi:hypothetical protein
LVEVANLMEAAGLTYRWCAAIVYNLMSYYRKVYPPFLPCWRPVLVFTRSAWNHKGLQVVCDTQTVIRERPDDNLIVVQQPLSPWQKWLAALTRPGDLVADPFDGVGTFGVAIKSGPPGPGRPPAAGGRKYRAEGRAAPRAVDAADTAEPAQGCGNRVRKSPAPAHAGHCESGRTTRAR